MFSKLKTSSRKNLLGGKYPQNIPFTGSGGPQ
jgi:hypothetical protein